MQSVGNPQLAIKIRWFQNIQVGINLILQVSFV